ncbi:MAG: NADH-quinone oxidoreductase subunit NuoG [Candidatus Methylomirabilales bacterium]
MATIYVDGEGHHVRDGQNLLHACLSLKLDLPYFCWHPALGSVGACRQCAVKQFKDEADTRGRIVMACMTSALDGTRISLADEEARAFRAQVIEWLMVNHPHDCPVCDEGGECHLQDMTVMTGHVTRRHRFPKRTHRNQYLGPFIEHEMNRCIQCYRCVRYYRDYAGGRDLDVFGAHDQVYFGRQRDGVLESEFSGNLVEVCPTGVFTDKTLRRHYTRKWDLQSAPSVCVHCSVGCDTIASERYGELRRILNRYNGEVNGYFLCDRGRFGYEFVNGDRRIRKITARLKGEVRVLPRAAALGQIAAWLREGPAVGIGSPRASLEANFALRTLVGAERFSLGLAAADAALLRAVLEALRAGPARTPSLREVGEADAVLILGEDASNTAPMLALALRQSVRRQPMALAESLKIPGWHDNAVRDVVRGATGPLFIATPAATRLDDVATRAWRLAPDGIARLGLGVAAALSGGPPPPDLSAPAQAAAREVAAALRAAQRPLVVSGTGAASVPVIQAAGEVARVLAGQGRAARLSYALPECNSMGLALLGGLDLEQAFALARDGRHTVVVLENDLRRRAPATEVDACLRAARHVVVLDHTLTATAAQAEVVLPSATFAEGDGTLVNQEGRAQRSCQVFPPGGDVQEAWRWAADLLAGIEGGGAARWGALDEVAAEMAAALPVFAPLLDLRPPPPYRGGSPLESVARQSPRYSGRTAMLADRTVHEPPPPRDPDSPLVFSMEGRPGVPPPSLIPLFWAPGWNSVQATAKYQAEVGGPLLGGDPGRRLLEPPHPAPLPRAGGEGGPEGAAAEPGVQEAPTQGFPLPREGGEGEGEGAGPREAPSPAVFPPRDGRLLAVPLFEVFGSEELSALAPAVRERLAAPGIALHPDDAAARGAAPGDSMLVEVGGLELRLPLAAPRDLPPGVAGLTVGLPGAPWMPLPAWAVVRKGS